MIRSFIICAFTRHFYGDKIKNNELGGVCSTYETDGNAYRMLVGKRERKIPPRRG
jgi:hypothetical protein